MLVAGLARGVHCVGMCGGIVGAFAARGVIPIRDARAGEAACMSGALPVQAVLYVLVNFMLVLIGLYLAGAGGLLRRAERLGAPLWRRLQPLAAHLLGARTLAAGLRRGSGMGVAALRAGVRCAYGYGALAMLAFGLGQAAGVAESIRRGLLCLWEKT